MSYGLENEFTVVMDVDMNHEASAPKDLTTIFDGSYDIISEETARKALGWLEHGAEAPKSVALRMVGPDGITRTAGDVDEWHRWCVAAIAKMETGAALREWRASIGPHIAEMSGTYPA